MKKSFLIIALICLSLSGYCQLPNGSNAPDFDVEDVFGNTYSLYAMMGTNKSACVGFEATWCSFCWHLHESGVLQNVTNNLSAYTTVVMLESDWDTNTDCLFGLPSCNNYTWGDWVAGMPYTVADLSSTNGSTVASDYDRYSYPLLYVISPDKRTWLIVERSYQNYSNWITKSFALNATASLTHSVCGDNGKIILNVTGGFSTLNYKWSNGATTKDLNNIPGGTYSVTITDANQYFKSFGPWIIDGPAKRVDITSYSLANVKCFDGATGSIELEVDFGTPPYTYNWSNGNKSNFNPNLKAGTYSLTIADNKSCTRIKTFTVSQPPLLTATAISSKELCDNMDGSIQLKALGGFPPYVFDIGDGDQGNSEFKKLKGGKDYSVTITDFNGCKELLKINVDATHKPKADAGIDKPLDCIHDTISLDGSQSEQSAWMANVWSTIDGNILKGAETLFPDVDKPGTYYLKVTNTNNKCFNVDSVVVKDERFYPDINATGDTTLNCLFTGTDLRGSSNYEPVRYYWKKINDSIFISTEKTIHVSDSGKYVFHVIDTMNLCIAKDTVEIKTDQQKPEALAAPARDVSCTHTEIVIDATSSSRGAQFEYQWTSVDGNIVNGANTLNPVINKGGVYLLEVINKENFCKASIDVKINEQTQPIAEFDQNVEGLKVQFNDRSQGRPLTWSWTFGDGTAESEKNPVHNYASDGTYEVCLTIENECGLNKKCDKINVGIVTASAPLRTVKEFSINPNPVNGNGIIKIDLDQIRSFKINVLNVFGESIYNKSGTAKNESIHIDFNDFSKGLYFVVLSSGNSQLALKWIVE